MNLSSLIPTSSPRLSPIRSNPPSRVSGRENSAAIEARNVNFSVSTRQGITLPILTDCSLVIPSGQLWMLLGPNGCGKSTLLKILAGLLTPTNGKVYVKRPKNYVFQNPDHQVVMPTVEADVAFGLGKSGLTSTEVRSKVLRALDAVGMSDYVQRPIQTLSGGQKQRVAIAGALAEACKVLLLDELTTFLDETDQHFSLVVKFINRKMTWQSTWRTTRRLPHHFSIGVIKAVKNCLEKSEDVTALWVTHRLEELEYADGAIYMEDGKVIKRGDPMRIMNLIRAKQSSYSNHINSS